MPELPEVETIKEGLKNRVMGLEVREIEIRESKLFRGEKRRVIGAKVVDIWRRAKVLLMEFDNQMTIAIHFKMTGQLIYQGADEKIKMVGGHPQREYNQPLPHKHTHVIIYFTDGSRLYFNDLRKFGWVMVLNKKELSEQSFIKNVGPEPFSVDYTFDYFMGGLSRRSRSFIKLALMDPAFIAGVGNIYSDEILYLAGVRSDRRAGSLSPFEVEKIFKVVPYVLLRAIKRGGTSDSTFIGVDGARGTYLKSAYVYHQEKDPKGHPVMRKKMGGRTAHFCEICQK